MRDFTTVFRSLFVAALTVAWLDATALAADPDASARTPEQVIAHHIAADNAGDLDAAMDDYADDVVVISAAGVVRGKAALRAQLAKMLQPPPATAAVERPKVLAQQYTSEVAWLIAVQNLGKPNEVRGVETFLVRKGKITLQTAGIVSVHSAATAQ